MYIYIYTSYAAKCVSMFVASIIHYWYCRLWSRPAWEWKQPGKAAMRIAAMMFTCCCRTPNITYMTTKNMVTTPVASRPSLAGSF